MSRSWIRHLPWLQLGEQSVIAWAMGLVITGHMLPAGGIAAQEPAVPTLSVPEAPQAEPPVTSAVETPAAPEPEKPADAVATPVAIEALPVAAVSPMGPEPLNTEERVYKFDDWTVTIRPAPKNIVRIPEPVRASVVPVSHVQVPVNVQVNNTVPMMPWNWSVDSTYTPWMQAPTSNYLFERPRPYWQLRGDFHHLRPYIRW